MKKLAPNKLLALVLGGFITIPSQADTLLGIYLSASSWSPDISGAIESTGPSISLNETLGFDDDTAKLLSLRFEHGIPVLPNIGVQNNTIDSNSVATLTETITYDGSVYQIDETVSSVLDLSHQELLLYYEVLDNWLNLDLGINILRFDGEVSIASSSQTSRTVLDDMIPTLYAAVAFDFPTTGTTIGASISYLGIDDNNFSKSRLFLAWESETGLGFELGHQRFDADWIDFNDSNGNLSFAGYYASLNYHF